jgi:hypothetical protein
MLLVMVYGGGYRRVGRSGDRNRDGNFGDSRVNGGVVGSYCH